MTRRHMGMQRPEIVNSATASAEFTPTDEQIRYRAYEILRRAAPRWRLR